MSGLDPDREWSPRTQELVDNPHIREQAKRVHKILKIVRGTKDCPTFKETLTNIAQLVALCEVTGCRRTANVGGITVERGPMEGYGISVHAADAYVLHIGMNAESGSQGYQRAQEFWAREERQA